MIYFYYTSKAEIIVTIDTILPKKQYVQEVITIKVVHVEQIEKCNFLLGNENKVKPEFHLDSSESDLLPQITSKLKK